MLTRFRNVPLAKEDVFLTLSPGQPKKKKKKKKNKRKKPILDGNPITFDFETVSQIFVNCVRSFVIPKLGI